MNINSKTTNREGDKPMNTNRQTVIKENKMKVTTSNLIRAAGLAAMASGILFIVIQAIHPLDVLSSVTTARWAIVHYLSIAMDILGLLGLAGLYARQVEKSGWLGLAGYLLFSLFWASSLGFHFIEVFITPLLATNAPKLAEGLLGIVNGAPSEINLGALPAVNTLAGIVGYALGGLLFAIAMFRARILPRWASVLLAVSIVLPFFTHSLVQHPYDRIFAVPVGLAIAWLGYALFSEHRAPASASEPLPIKVSPLPVQTGAD
jgi:hypothetical protein